MSLSRWKKISEVILFENPWWTYKKDETKLPNGNQGVYHYVHTKGASMVVPILEDGRIVLVNQFRYLNDKESLEFPCGGVKANHSYEQTALHELEEEAGFSTQELHKVGEFNPYNGVTDEICRVFIARNLQAVPQKPDETEEFERKVIEPEIIDSLVTSGIIWDGMTIAAWTISKPFIIKKI
jgi:ADP-ribose pyrophosphatase